MFQPIRRIENPTIGFFDITAGKASREISEDKNAVASLFTASTDSSTFAPKCDVLYIYCRIEDDGNIESSSQSLREIIRDSGPSVVVVATENSAAAYIAAGKKKNRERQSCNDAEQKRRGVWKLLSTSLRRNEEGYFNASCLGRVCAARNCLGTF
jgi:hypothetical protein